MVDIKDKVEEMCACFKGYSGLLSMASPIYHHYCPVNDAWLTESSMHSAIHSESIRISKEIENRVDSQGLVLEVYHPLDIKAGS